MKWLNDLGNTVSDLGSNISDGFGFTGNDSWFDNTGGSDWMYSDAGRFAGIGPTSNPTNGYSAEENTYFNNADIGESPWYSELGSNLSDFAGSKAGTNLLQYGTPLVSGILGSRATDRAAQLQADSADRQADLYQQSLDSDQARIDADQRRRDEAAAAMSSGFNSGLGRV